MTFLARFKRACAVATMVALAACADWSQLAFRQDHRLRFIAPRSHELVQLPLTLKWTMDDFRIVRPGSGTPHPGAGYFAIFVDVAPVKPGEKLRAVARDDPACRLDPKCPDPKYLADRGIYTARKTSLTLRWIPPLPTGETEQLHDVSVVLLDSAGRWIGESAWNLQFKLQKKTS